MCFITFSESSYFTTLSVMHCVYYFFFSLRRLFVLFSIYLYAVSDRTLEKISCNFTDAGFDRQAVFGSDFSNELRNYDDSDLPVDDD